MAKVERFAALVQFIMIVFFCYFLSVFAWEKLVSVQALSLNSSCISEFSHEHSNYCFTKLPQLTRAERVKWIVT
jgi:hypothetical protein